MSEEHDSNVSAKAPLCDYADGLKWMYNGVSLLRAKKCKLLDQQSTYIVGAGRYNGVDTEKWADEAAKRLLYFSYRNCFAPLRNGATTDLSWGCMIRAGQMLLAYAFMRFFNGGGACIDIKNVQELRQKTQVLFLDVPEAPFGIHAITREGEQHGISCGRWFGPTPIAITLSALAATYLNTGGDGPVVLALPNREVNIEEVTELLKRSKHVLLLIPVMLGIDVISEKYAKLVKQCFEMESSAGILGGFHGSAFFLFGYQGDNVFYLDPHSVQRASTTPNNSDALTCPLRAMPVTDYNTSMTLGFYISSLNSLTRFEEDMARANASLTFPLVSVTHGRHTLQVVVRDSKDFSILSND